MQRIYNDHLVRQVTDLNGIWKFRADPTDCGKDEKWFCGLPNAEGMDCRSNASGR